MRIAQPVARRRPRRPSRPRSARLRGFDRRPGRPAAPPARRRGGPRHRRAPPAADPHPPRPTRVGRATAVRRNHRNPDVRRPVHPTRTRTGDGARRRPGHPRPGRRGRLPRHLPHPDNRTHHRSPGRPETADPGAHARTIVHRRLPDRVAAPRRRLRRTAHPGHFPAARVFDDRHDPDLRPGHPAPHPGGSRHPGQGRIPAVPRRAAALRPEDASRSTDCTGPSRTSSLTSWARPRASRHYAKRSINGGAADAPVGILVPPSSSTVSTTSRSENVATARSTNSWNA